MNQIDAEYLPRDEELEKVVLRLLFDIKTCDKVLNKLEPKDFLVKEHKLILYGIKDLREKGIEVDPIALERELKEKHREGKITWKTYIYNISTLDVVLSNCGGYLEKLYNIGKRRELVIAGTQLIKNASDLTLPIEELVKEVEPHIETIRKSSNSSVKTYSGENYWTLRKTILQARQDREPVMTNWENLDRYLVEGLAKKSVSVIAARPAMGKSAFKSNIIKNLCSKGNCVVSAATEQSAETETDRLDALISGLNLREIMNSRKWAPNDHKIKKIVEANRMIKDWQYYLIPSRGLTTETLAIECRKINSHFPIDLIIIDLFDKLKDVNVAMNKTQSVGVHLGTMNQLAEELDCHICLLVQVNRKVEERRDHRPKISDIKDSGSFEEVARLIMLLYRDRYYNVDVMHNQVEVNIGKQNNGVAGRDVIALFNLIEDTLAFEPIEIGGRDFSE